MRWLWLALLAGCAPSGEIILYVDTDAAVPSTANDGPDPLRPPALFDRLRIEILRNGMPALAVGASRDFAVDTARFHNRAVSIGIAPQFGDDTLSARVRLFRGDRATDGNPPPLNTLDTTVALPAIGSTEHRELTVILHTEHVGVPQMAVPEQGPPSRSLVGSWPGAHVVPCIGEPGAEEACVPGGAFWMGASTTIGFAGIEKSTEHLVVVSPFFIDVAEVTLAEFRPGYPRAGEIYALRTHTDDPTCVYSETPGSFESLPMNCVARDNAERYCRALGKVLPTEAQYEFVSSGRGQEWTFPWGNDDPGCGDAVLGRGGPMYDTTCGLLPNAPGMSPKGTGRLDQVPLGERTVVDLAANLAELMRDAYSTDPAPPLSVDPFVKPSADDDVPIRGGSYLLGALQAHATSRDVSPAAGNSPAAGFRCVRVSK